MTTTKDISAPVPNSYPMHCDASVAKMVVGGTIIFLLTATCLYWPVLAGGGQSAAHLGSHGAWSQVCEAIHMFTRR